MIIIYTVFSSKKEAQKIVGALIDSRLIACGNCWPIESCYIWQGKKERAPEVAGFLKTAKKNYNKVERFILKNHSYSVPCIVRIAARGNTSYLFYLSNSLK